MELAENHASLHYGQKLKIIDSFAGIHVLLGPNFYIGMGLVRTFVLSLSPLALKIHNGSVTILAWQRSSSIGMVHVLTHALLL